MTTSIRQYGQTGMPGWLVAERIPPHASHALILLRTGTHFRRSWQRPYATMRSYRITLHKEYTNRAATGGYGRMMFAASVATVRRSGQGSRTLKYPTGVWYNRRRGIICVVSRRVSMTHRH